MLSEIIPMIIHTYKSFHNSSRNFIFSSTIHMYMQYENKHMKTNVERKKDKEVISRVLER